MSLLSHPDGQPVRSLHYFEPVLREVQREGFPESYWRHLELNLGRCEDYWQRQADAGASGGRPNLEQAGRGGSLPRSLQEPKGEKG